MREPNTWDIFCRVVDNFGDAGVCWRLARQLVDERGARVRLVIDDLPSLQRLAPAVALTLHQDIDGVEIRQWQEPLSTMPGCDVVIEAFGCGLPDEYVAALAGLPSSPLWIVLEYLSAEPWTRENHGLASPHPRAPLERYFFFPGFIAGTGGLLREANLFARRDAFGQEQRERCWRSVGHAVAPAEALVVSLFAYESAPMRDLLDTWVESERPVVAAVPEGGALRVALEFFGASGSASRVHRRGALELRVIPFVPQAEYDHLLWACDCNFVRGEDSFVRAQWAARPFVWQVYPQADRAHHEKLEAFHLLYEEGLDIPARDALRNMMAVWNQIPRAGVTMRSAWGAFEAQLQALRQHGLQWADRLASGPSLVEMLVRFCAAKLQ